MEVGKFRRPLGRDKIRIRKGPSPEIIHSKRQVRTATLDRPTNLFGQDTHASR
jgi:hypothetical protein